MTSTDVPPRTNSICSKEDVTKQRNGLPYFFDHIRVEAAFRSELDKIEPIIDKLESLITNDTSDSDITRIYCLASMLEYNVLHELFSDSDISSFYDQVVQVGFNII